MNNPIGQTLLNQYRVDGFIGAGGMSTVYKAYDQKRSVYLAMKVLHADLADDPSVFKLFRREARALRKLAHPNIVPFYGFYQDLGFTFLLERFVDGPSLKDILRQQQKLPLQETLAYLKSMCAALGYAHVNGVVHCDVKPGNVMVDRGSTIYITDFGVARHAESTTTTLAAAGTPAYMAPEQILGEAVSAETDVYALGIVLYEMLTSQRPFLGTGSGTQSAGQTAEIRIRYAHLKVPPPNPRDINPSIPLALAQVLLKALAKEPNERYRGTQEMFAAACVAVNMKPEEIPDRMIVPINVVSGENDGKKQPKKGIVERFVRWAGISGVLIIGGVGLVFLVFACYIVLSIIPPVPMSTATIEPAPVVVTVITTKIVSKQIPFVTETSPPVVTATGLPTVTPTSTVLPSPTPTKKRTSASVLWDTSHKPRVGNAGAYTPDEIYSDLKALLADQNIRLVEGGLSSLSNYDAVVISATSVYDASPTSTEIDLISQYVKDGGGLLILGEDNRFPNEIQPIASEFGIKVAQIPELESISNFADVSIFAGVDEIEFFRGGTLKVLSSTAEPVAWENGAIAIIIATPSSGRVVVIGDSNLFDNRWLDPNRIFAVNVFRWITFLMD